MIRWASLLIAVTACASSPPAARLFAPGTGECTDASGCAVPLDQEPKYVTPDEGHAPPDDPNLGPAETREATCTDVALSVASMEVGDYATDEEREPVASKYRARCLKARLDRTERQCVFGAADAATVAYCAPRFWPEVKIELVDTVTCAYLTQKIRERMGPLPQGHLAKERWERELSAVQRSCEEDRWTAAFGECAAGMQSSSYVVPNCQHLAPAPLATRLQDRMAKAMNP